MSLNKHEQDAAFNQLAAHQHKVRKEAMYRLVEVCKEVLTLHGWTPDDLQDRMASGREAYGEFVPSSDARSLDDFAEAICEEVADIVNYYGMRGAKKAYLDQVAKLGEERAKEQRDQRERQRLQSLGES